MSTILLYRRDVCLYVVTECRVCYRIGCKEAPIGGPLALLAEGSICPFVFTNFVNEDTAWVSKIEDTL